MIIDRRKNGKNKSIVNRNRFLERAKNTIKEQVDNIIKDKSIKDIGKGDQITIPKKGITEPSFHNGKGGNRKYVLPGNKSLSKGDTIKKPEGGSGQGGGDEAGTGKSQDDFTFNITREEFLDYFFEDLELPDLVKTQLKDVTDYKVSRNGFVNNGIPTNISIVRSMRNAIGRKIALEANFDNQIKELEKEYEQTKDDALLIKIEELKKKRKNVPFIDEFDLRYKSFEMKPVPSTKCLQFCVMDTSGSMGEYEKDLAKRFYLLLYLFLEKKYEKVEVVFISHTDEAQEVDEQEFFYGTESGGTKVSPALELVHKIINERYSTSDYNIYLASVSDGDNSSSDNQPCHQILSNDIMPLIQHLFYIQVAHKHSTYHEEGSGGLWDIYKKLESEFNNVDVAFLKQQSDIYPVFRELFSKELS
jgi:uncharacterized sporulation protein YeaH/YhbH (DUF444 family)